MGERRPIPGCPGYVIEADGTVWDVRTDYACRVAPNGLGYVALKSADGKSAQAFRASSMADRVFQPEPAEDLDAMQHEVDEALLDAVARADESD